MKSIKFAALAFAGLAMFSQSAQAVPTSTGDLLLALYEPSSGQGYGDTYAVDLGAETQFTTTASTINLSNLVSSTDLNTIFGSNLSNAVWEVVGTPSTSPVNFDGVTVYNDAVIATDPTAPGTYSHNGLSTASANIGSFLTGGSGIAGTSAYSANSAEAVLINTASPTPEGTTEWGLSGLSPAVAPEVSFGSTATLYLLDPHSNSTGAVAGTTTTLGTFQFVGGTTFEYNYSAVPEPSTYALLGLGALLLVWIVRRRSASNL